MGRDLKLSTRPHRRLPQLHHQALERLPLRRDERRLRGRPRVRRESYASPYGTPDRPKSRPPTAGSSARPAASAKRSTTRSPPSASTTPPTRSTPSSGARSATGTWNSPSPCSTGKRLRPRQRAMHGLGPRPVPDPAAPDHALHHRRALGPPRAGATSMLVHADWPSYGAELVDPASESRDALGHLADRRHPLRPRRRCTSPPACRSPLLRLELAMPPRATPGRANEPLIRRLARVDTLTRGRAAPKGATTIAGRGRAPSPSRSPTSSTWTPKRRAFPRP